MWQNLPFRLNFYKVKRQGNLEILLEKTNCISCLCILERRQNI